MKNNSFIIYVLLSMGMVISGIALFAKVLSLDKNSGDWSQARITLLGVGLVLVIIATICFHFGPRFITIVSRIWSTFQKQPNISRLVSREVVRNSVMIIRTHIATVSIPIIILLFYAWLTSSGTWTTWKSETYYYASLADSFVQGKLYLSTKPDPRLLALSNPYDPSARTGIDVLADLSLYQGKFYIYWGPVPALFLAASQYFTRSQAGDAVVTLIFVYGIFLVQTLLLHTIWERFFSSLPSWTLHLSILLTGLTGPIILLRHNYENAKIYEAAIAGGQFFLISGFALAVLTLSRTPTWKLLIIGLLWTFAFGTRHNLLPSIGVMFLLMSLWILKSQATFPTKIKNIIYLGLPLALGMIAWGWYNWARFGSITETGFSYALAGINIQEPNSKLFSQDYITPNLYNYLINPPDFTTAFPFIMMLKGIESSTLFFNDVPGFYNAQPIVGLVFIFPFGVFAILPLMRLIININKNKSLVFAMDTLNHNEQNWIIMNLIAACLLAFGLLMGFFWAGLRYMGDFLMLLIILSVLGFWQGYQSLVQRSTAINLYTLIAITMIETSIFSSVLFMISTNSRLVGLIVKNFVALF